MVPMVVGDIKCFSSRVFNVNNQNKNGEYRACEGSETVG